MKLPSFTMERLRDLALGMIVVLNALATVVSFEESYAGLYQWAHQHNVFGFNAGIWPLMVDVIILVAEAGLFVAHHDKWKWQHKVWLWFVMFTALGVSTGGNTGHVQSTDWLSHLTAALPPVALMFTMTVGFGVMKRTFMNKPVIRPASQALSDPILSEWREKAERELRPASMLQPATLSEPPGETSHERVAPAETPAPLTPPETPPERSAETSSESPDSRLTETLVKAGWKTTEKSYTMPPDPRKELTLPEKRTRDMYDVDPDISVNAIKDALGIAWATAKKYLEATKEARGVA